MATTEANNTDLARAEILWKSADTLRGQIDAAEYKHVVLGLLFLKYIATLIDDAILAVERDNPNFGSQPTDSFLHNPHPDLQADYILANPPFNISDWGEERLAGDKRWHCGAFQQSSDHRIFPGPHAGVLNGR